MSAVPGRFPHLLSNPIIIAGARARLRPQHILSFGMVTLVTCAFITLAIYLTEREQTDMTAITAARSTLLPTIIIQGVILMFGGTSRIASAVVYEREQLLVDYQRMTPMSPTARIFGYLFGLPAREYFMFLMTMPCIVFGVVVGQMPIMTMLHFYMIFFTSVWLYHLTGLVLGMVTRKPRNALVMSLAVVAVLYLILPQFSTLGFTFFEFLTIRPTLFGMVNQQIEELGPGVQAAAQAQFPGLDEFRDIRFFGVDLHPTVYTLMCQGFLIVTMYTMVFRKWQDQEAHPLSKVDAIVFYAIAMAMLTGNLWPYLSDVAQLAELTFRLNMENTQGENFVAFVIISSVFLSICGAVALFLINAVSPSGYTTAKGWRLARKDGRTSLPFNSDAASSAPVAIAIIVMTAIAFFGNAVTAQRSQLFFDSLPPLYNVVAPVLLFACIVLAVQALRERMSSVMWLTALFVLWAIPMFCSVILWAAYEQWEIGTYIGLTCPIVSGGLSIYEFFRNAGYAPGSAPSFDDDGPFTQPVQMLAAGLGVYVVLAVGFQTSLWRWRSRIKQRELGEEPAPLPAAA